MNGSVPILAAVDSGIIATALTALIMPILIAYAMHSSQRESRRKACLRIATYPMVMRIIVICISTFCIAIIVFVSFLAKDANIKDVLAVNGIFTPPVLILNLEVFGSLITWDEKHIYTKSFWRKSRVIPLRSVTKCDYSGFMQWYRVYTEEHGIIRVPSIMYGIPVFFEVLPCSTPSYPPL